MVEPVSLQTVLTYLTLISIPVGVVYHIMTLRNSQKIQKHAQDTRQAQLLMQIYDHLREDKFNTQYTNLFQYEWKDYDDFIARFSDDLEFRAMMNYVGSFFEGVGVLVYRNLLDPKLVDDLMSSYVFRVWEKIGPVIKESRIRHNRPELWEYFEYLYDEIMKIYIQEHGHRFSPTE